jgi:hypothetical protein
MATVAEDPFGALISLCGGDHELTHEVLTGGAQVLEVEKAFEVSGDLALVHGGTLRVRCRPLWERTEGRRICAVGEPKAKLGISLRDGRRRGRARRVPR